MSTRASRLLGIRDFQSSQSPRYPGPSKLLGYRVSLEPTRSSIPTSHKSLSAPNKGFQGSYGSLESYKLPEFSWFPLCSRAL